MKPTFFDLLEQNTEPTMQLAVDVSEEAMAIVRNGAMVVVTPEQRDHVLMLLRHATIAQGQLAEALKSLRAAVAMTMRVDQGGQHGG